MTYFPGGEAKFEELLRQLETAEEYIFVEYFIIDEGLMWARSWKCWPARRCRAWMSG